MTIKIFSQINTAFLFHMCGEALFPIGCWKLRLLIFQEYSGESYI